MENVIVFTKNNKLTPTSQKSKIITNLKKVEKLINDDMKFKKLQKELISKLKSNDNVSVIINGNNYRMTGGGEDEYIPKPIDYDEKLQNELQEALGGLSPPNQDEEKEDQDFKSYQTGGMYQTSIFGEDDSDEESIIHNARQLKKLNIYQLRDIMRNNNLQITRGGNYLKKNQMINKIRKI
jgi:hypothetical protein